jgi:hypothetical protein
MRKATLQELGKVFFLSGFLTMPIWLVVGNTITLIAGFGLILLSFLFLSLGSRIGK